MNYKWIVLFLVHASNNHTLEHAKALFKMLERTDYNEEIKVLVLFGGLQSSILEGYRIQVTLKELVKDQHTNRLHLIEIQPGYGTFDMGDDKKLSVIFSEIREKYPSDRFLLFTWDHGSGFGVFKTDPRERDIQNRETFLNFEMDIMKNNTRSMPSLENNIKFSIINNSSYIDGIDSRETGETRGIEKKKVKTSMLTNDELRKIIKYGTDAKKVDLLIMMNCAMQMIETGYALNDAVEFLVAPETCIFWAGYDYISILNKLSVNPEIETETLGKFAIDTIQAYYEHTPCRDYFNDLVVSLVKPAKSVEVVKVIDAIAATLNIKLAESFNDIRNIRSDCEDLTCKYVAPTPYHYIDFLHVVAALTQVTGNTDLESVKQVMHEYVIHIMKGNYYSSVNLENNIGQVNGCTIYFPPGSHEADSDYYYGWFYKAGNQQTLFAKDCRWKDFLLNYFMNDRKSIKKMNIS